MCIRGGPPSGVRGSHVVGLILHSSQAEMLPALRSITAAGSAWPDSGFLGAFVDQPPAGGAEGVRRAAPPHGAAGAGWELRAEAAFVSAAYQWWEAGASAVGGAGIAGVSLADIKALAPLRRPTKRQGDVSEQLAEAGGLRDGVFTRAFVATRRRWWKRGIAIVLIGLLVAASVYGTLRSDRAASAQSGGATEGKRLE